MAEPQVPSRWYEKATAVLFAIFCFEMGLFLLLFPWFGHWEVNYFAWLAPESSNGLEFAQRWRSIWLNPYFRGAVSGLGVINIWIAFQEVFRLRRFTRPDKADEQGSVGDPKVSIR